MNFIWDKITEWLKELLVSGVVSNLSGLFDSINSKVADVAGTVGASPQTWNSSIFNMIRSLSENVMVPIAGIILTFVMCLDLIQMLIDRNNMHDVDTWMFFKWVFKTFCAVLIVTNTWNIVMGVFDVAQHVVNQAAGVIIGDTAMDISTLMGDIEARLMEMEIGPLFGLWFQSSLIGIIAWALSICIFIICLKTPDAGLSEALKSASNLPMESVMFVWIRWERSIQKLPCVLRLPVIVFIFPRYQEVSSRPVRWNC